MSPLVDTQRSMAAALLAGESRSAPASLSGGRDPRSRFAIHIRHYQTSLRTALSEKFPATAWLVGTKLFAEAATAYAREHPPSAPCIAEYGSTFPEFLSVLDRTKDMPYLLSFAELERTLGRVAIAVDEKALGWHELVSAGPDALLDAGIELQPCVAYVRATHPVDMLIRIFLDGSEPDSLDLPRRETLIEVIGSRGAFAMNRIGRASFAFRAALLGGKSVNDAADDALEADPAFDPGVALRDLAEQNLVVSTRINQR